ncbi:hypothetical protein C8R47DRAFT_503998 [Mycena vitilis]|nr:hypothetical protein C8R47DRAFT_503998 [Mycena vitilis]
MSVAELQTRIEKFSADIELQKDVLKQLEINKSATQRQLNAIRDPVVRLPVEITSNIFLECLPEHRIPNSRAAPMLLLNVCNAWTDIALATPALWASIRLDFSCAAVMKTWLQRARNHALSITVSRSLDTEVATLICQHGEQLKNLEIREAKHDIGVLATLGAFPCLQTLTIASASNELHFFDLTAIISLLRRTPNLVQCTLDNVWYYPGYDWSNAGEVALPLRCLRFGEDIDGLGSDDDEILCCLSLPDLETLSLPLNNSSSTTFPQFLERSSPPLRSLTIGEGCGSLSFTQLNGCLLLVPSLTHLELFSSCTNDILSALADSPSHFLPNLRSLRIQHSQPTSEESYRRVLRALSVRHAQLVFFALQSEYGVPVDPSPDVRAGLQELVSDGMVICLGTRKRSLIFDQ